MFWLKNTKNNLRVSHNSSAKFHAKIFGGHNMNILFFVRLFDLILYVQVNIFTVMSEQVFLG